MPRASDRQTYSVRNFAKHMHVPVNLAKDFRQADLFRQNLGERVKNCRHSITHSCILCKRKMMADNPAHNCGLAKCARAKRGECHCWLGTSHSQWRACRNKLRADGYPVSYREPDWGSVIVPLKTRTAPRTCIYCSVSVQNKRNAISTLVTNKSTQVVVNIVP